MNKEQLAEELKAKRGNRKAENSVLTAYAIESIETGRSSYPVSNLLIYCKEVSLQIILQDWATEENIPVSTVLEVHKAIEMLMKRYNLDPTKVSRLAKVHYTVPTTFNEKMLKALQSKTGKPAAPLSISTLLSVCSVLHCELKVVPSDESSVIINSPTSYDDKKRSS